jgi:hypothetical protein
MNETGNTGYISANSVPLVTRGAAAMATKRRELIAQPLDRIWPDLMRAAIEAMREPTVEMVEAIWKHANLDWAEAAQAWDDAIDEALKPTQPASESSWTDCIHDWAEVNFDLGGNRTAVKCKKCQCPGERDNNGEIFWPAT